MTTSTIAHLFSFCSTCHTFLLCVSMCWHHLVLTFDLTQKWIFSIWIFFIMKQTWQRIRSDPIRTYKSCCAFAAYAVLGLAGSATGPALLDLQRQVSARHLSDVAAVLCTRSAGNLIGSFLCNLFLFLSISFQRLNLDLDTKRKKPRSFDRALQCNVLLLSIDSRQKIFRIFALHFTSQAYISDLSWNLQSIEFPLSDNKLPVFLSLRSSMVNHIDPGLIHRSAKALFILLAFIPIVKYEITFDRRKEISSHSNQFLVALPKFGQIAITKCLFFILKFPQLDVFFASNQCNCVHN